MKRCRGILRINAISNRLSTNVDHLPLRSCRRRFASILAVGIFAAAVPFAADAQSNNQVAAFGALEDRLNALRATGPGGLLSRNFFVPSKFYWGMFMDGVANCPDQNPDGTCPSQPLQYTLSFTTPLGYNSNPTQSPTAADSSLEITPDFHAGIQKSLTLLGGLSLSGSADILSDTFPSNHEANNDAINTQWQIQRVTGSDDQEFQPYIAFATSNILKTTFGSQILAEKLFSIGFDKAFDFAADGSRLRNQEDIPLDSYTIWQIGLTGYVGRSWAVGVANDWEAKFSPSFVYNGNNGENTDVDKIRWSISVAANVKYTYFDRAAGQHERDWAIDPVVTLNLIPAVSWFGRPISDVGAATMKNLGAPTISMQVAYLDTTSNQAPKAFRQSTVSPSLVLTWNF